MAQEAKLFRPMLNDGVLRGRLQMSYPNSRLPERAVTAALVEGNLEEVLMDMFDFPWTDTCLSRFRPGRRLQTMPETSSAVYHAASVAMPRDEEMGGQRRRWLSARRG